MRIAAIICEYNPLHSGHAYQISRLKQQADRVVCIMSASFVQRGEPAFYDKWHRASWALKAGADMVVELPCIFSLRPAKDFALGGVAVAKGIGADALCFGVENDDISLLKSIAGLQLDEPERYVARLRQGLADGLSYPAAMEAATNECMDIPGQLFKPNNTLAMEYIKAAMSLEYNVEFIPIKRMGEVASSKCRRIICMQCESSGGSFCAYEMHDSADMPDYVTCDLPELRYVTLGGMSDMLMYALRMLPAAAYPGLPDISEGLENRIYKAARNQTTLDGLLADIAVKRYPMARIKRILCLAMLGISRRTLDENSEPAYARILGMGRDAGTLVHAMQKRGTLPVITRPVELKDFPIFHLEQRATDIRAIAEGKPSGMDFTQPLVII